MVKYNIILKAIDNYLNKCHITLKSIKEQIEGLIFEISETDEEYNILMEHIPRFYRDYYNAPIEHLFGYDVNGNIYTQDGDETSVRFTEEQDITMEDNYGLFLSMHNHPTDINFLSFSDIGLSSKDKYRTMYNVVVTKKGIAINKQDRNWNYNDESSLNKESQRFNRCFNANELFREQIKNDIFPNEINDIMENMDKKIKETDNKSEQFQIRYDSLMQVEDLVADYITQEPQDCADRLNQAYEQYDVPMEMNIIPIKRNQ